MRYICISALSPPTIGCLSWFLPVLLPVMKYIIDSTPFIVVRKRQIGCQLFYFIFYSSFLKAVLYNASFISMWQWLLKFMLFLFLNYCYFVRLLHWSILSFFMQRFVMLFFDHNSMLLSFWLKHTYIQHHPPPQKKRKLCNFKELASIYIFKLAAEFV